MSLPKGVAQTISFAMWDPTTFEYVSGLTLTVTVQKDGAAPVAATNAATEIVTTGRYKLTLTATERNADEVVVAATDGTLTTLVTDYPGQDVLTPLVVVDTVADAIKAKTDNLPASPAAVGSNMGTVSSVTGAVASVSGAVGSVTGNVGGNVVGTVAGVTPYAGTPPTPPSAADNATAVWGTATKAVTSIPTVTGATLHADYNHAKDDVLTPLAVVDGNVDSVLADTGTDGVVVAAASKSGYALTTAPPTTAEIEAALLNEGDSSALLQAIADKVSGDWSAGDVSATAVASAVRTNLATELGRIDAAITTRSTYAGGDTSGTTELLTRIPDATPGTASGLPLKSDLPAAAPTPDVIADEVETRTIAAVASIPAVTGATLSIAYDHAKDDTLGAIGALNDFDHATDVVAHVTLVDTTTTNTDMASVGGLSTFDPALDVVAHVTLVDTTTTNTDMVSAAPSIADLPTNSELASAIADLAHVDAAPDISGLATKTEILALSPVTAAADPADVAALILVTPANKLVTNVDGSVNADATVDTAAIASDVVDALEVAGIPTLGVIEASTVLAMKADVAAIQAPTFSGTVTFDGTVDASVDMTPVTEAISAIPAPTFDGTVTFGGTVSAPSVTVNPTVLSTGERAAIAAVTNTLITTNHGTGTYGSATLAAGVTITPATLDTDGVALGRVMPYGRVTVYHGEDAEYVFDADADGDYSYELPVGSVWTLLARHAGYEDTSAEVSTETSVS